MNGRNGMCVKDIKKSRNRNKIKIKIKETKSTERKTARRIVVKKG